MIIPSTTPLHTLRFKTDVTRITELVVTYKQDGRLVLEKRLADATVDAENNTIWYKLTQEETLLFTQTKEVRVQVKAKFDSADVEASCIYTVPVGEVLNTEVL